MITVIIFNLTGCAQKAVSQEVFGKLPARPEISGQISEVAPPLVIQELRPSLEAYEPQVNIVTPQPGEILQDNNVEVRLQVKDLPIFKNSQLNLGPHLQVILDNQPYVDVYDLNQPLTFSDLVPGTHTLRVFASSPWYESFKNVGAYAQIEFHVFTKTEDNKPDPSLPLLTYSRPQGSYGAEPILLDFYLTNAPLPALAKNNLEDSMADWRIRCTINGESFVIDRWQSVYLKGFKPGKNWIKLEFLDGQGNPVINAFNSTTRTITYDPDSKDTLAQIFRGELSIEQLRGIVDPTYTAKIPQPEPTPTVTSTPAPKPTPIKSPVPIPSPEETPTTVPEKESTPQETPVVVPQEKSTSEEPGESQLKNQPIEQVNPEIAPQPSPEINPSTPQETPAVVPQEESTSEEPGESQLQNQPIEQINPGIAPQPSPEIKPSIPQETPAVVPQESTSEH
ncbi:MAG: hypothetical protein QNJ36_22035 [Calothrix sp. MO_167.B42]|nr:hypothetical protein [Calothrix sp. MO_167.B42]